MSEGDTLRTTVAAPAPVQADAGQHGRAALPPGDETVARGGYIF
jgi:hypothetical protein